MQEVRIAQGEALRPSLIEKGEEPLGARDVGFGAVDLQPVFAGGEFHVERLFGRQQVILAAAVQLVQVTRILIIKGLGGHG